MKKIFFIIMILNGFCSYTQTVSLDGISFGAGAVVESKENFLDGGYFELGYSKIKMSKPGIFYSHGTEFLGKVRFQNSKSGNLLGISSGFKYHFLASLLSLGLDVEYLQSITSKGGELNIVPNLQINMFTPELSVFCAYAINLTPRVYTNDHGRVLLGMRYVLSFKKGRLLNIKNEK